MNEERGRKEREKSKFPPLRDLISHALLLYYESESNGPVAEPTLHASLDLITLFGSHKDDSKA
jgi:hypothetical protein